MVSTLQGLHTQPWLHRCLLSISPLLANYGDKQRHKQEMALGLPSQEFLHYVSLTGYDSMNGLSSTSHSLFSKDSPKHPQKRKLLSALTRLVWDFFHDKLLTCHLAHRLRYPFPLVHERKQAVLRWISALKWLVHFWEQRAVFIRSLQKFIQEHIIMHRQIWLNFCCCCL